MSAGDFLRRHFRRSTRFPGIRPRGSSRFLNVRMDTTNKCNLRCTMCPMRLSDSDPARVWHDMDPALFDRIAREVFPLAKTVAISCGAEPLCNPRFEEHLAALYRSDVPEREMVTNGVLLTPERSKAILACPPTSIFISVDGATESTHAAIRGGCSLDAVLGNLDALCRMKGRGRSPMVNFSTTLQRRNLAELGDIVSLAHRIGAASLCVVPLVPYEGLGTAGEALDMEADEVVSAVSAAAAQARAVGLGFTVSGRAVRPPGSPCPYCRSWVFIDPDGLVNPCPYWNVANPLGDLRRSSFREIWRGPLYECLRISAQSESCRVCPEVEGTGRAEVPKMGPPGEVRGSC